MSLKRFVAGGSLAAMAMVFLLVADVQSDDSKPDIIRQQYEGWDLEFFNNSATVSQALAINKSGSIIGMKENGNGQRNSYFYCGEKGCKEMPLPKGFTNVEAAAISDTEMVVGHTTKPIGSTGSLRAVIWSPDKSEINLLPTPEGDAVSDACDISDDGKVVTGYATGPNRLRPVVWEWNEAKSAWQIEVLPTPHENNPYLMSSQLIVSPDGRTIVGCCTDKILAGGTLDSSLYEWRKVDGNWTRRLVTEDQLFVKAINNKGEIAGSIAGNFGRLPCLVSLDGNMKLLQLLGGDVAGEARDINEDSVIVGWSDDPPGPDGGPTTCTWSVDGKVSQLNLSEVGFGMLYAINSKGQIAGTAEVITKPATAPNAGDEEAAMLAVRITKAK